jgi:hypothetical protein
VGDVTVTAPVRTRTTWTAHQQHSRNGLGAAAWVLLHGDTATSALSAITLGVHARWGNLSGRAGLVEWAGTKIPFPFIQLFLYFSKVQTWKTPNTIFLVSKNNETWQDCSLIQIEQNSLLVQVQNLSRFWIIKFQ